MRVVHNYPSSRLFIVQSGIDNSFLCCVLQNKIIKILNICILFPACLIFNGVFCGVACLILNCSIKEVAIIWKHDFSINTYPDAHDLFKKLQL